MAIELMRRTKGRGNAAPVLPSAVLLAALTVPASVAAGSGDSVPQLTPQVTNLSQTPLFPTGARPFFVGRAPDASHVTVAVATHGSGGGWAVYTREIEPDPTGLHPTNSRTFPAVASDPDRGLALAPDGGLLVGGSLYSPEPAGARRQFCELAGTCRVAVDPLARGFLVAGPSRIKRVNLPIAVWNRPLSFVGSRDYGVWLEAPVAQRTARSKAESLLRIVDLKHDALFASSPGVPRAYLVQTGRLLPISLDPMLEGVPAEAPVIERPVVARMAASGDVLAVGLESGKIAIWDVAREALRKRFTPRGKSRRIRDLCFLRSVPPRLAVLTEKQLLIVDQESERVLASYTARERLRSLAADAEGRYLAAVEDPDRVLIFFASENPALH